MYDWEWERGEAELQVAAELSPNDADVLASYGEYLQGICQYDEGRLLLEKAINAGRLDLNDRTSLLIGLYRQGKYEQAIEEAKKVLAIDPEFNFALWPLVFSYDALGRYDEWLEPYARYASRRGRSEEWVRGLRLAYREDGRAGAARYETEVEAQFASVLSLVWAYWILQDLDSAFKVLEGAAEERYPEIGPFLGCTEAWAPLRADPRGVDLLRRMNFPVAP